MGDNYPLVWIRKLIKAGGLLIDDQYWLGLGGYAREERINFYYDPKFNVMDDELTRNPSNVDYQGDFMAVVIFASLFKCRVVMYQASKPLLTYYLDGRDFDREKGKGILRATFDVSNH